MEITTKPVEPKLLEEFEITYTNGTIMSITLDLAAGDTYKIDRDCRFAVFNSVEKPSWSRPNITIPAEEITVIMPNVLCVQHRQRMFEDPTPEQREQWEQVLKGTFPQAH